MAIGTNAAMLAAAVALAGCAVQGGQAGRPMTVGLDEAELLGQTVGSFKLADGGEGRLRLFNGRYTIKLQRHFKVLAVEQAQVAKVLAAEAVGGRTLLVVEKGTNGCPYKTQLFAIQGGEALSWDFGDCRTQPEMRFGADEATFDHVQGRRVTRFTYKDGRLLRGDFTLPAEPAALPPPAQAQAQAQGSSPPPGGPRYVPGLPGSAAPLLGTAAPAAPERTAATARPAPAAAPAPPPRPAPAPVFTSQEQKPIRIVLDK